MNSPILNIDSEHFFNPFPGLRPFTTNESHLFFGREGQSQEVLDALAKNRFVALLGTSGSGKSSLMYCGVIPILEGGFITEAGEDWKTITCRPGQNPIMSLTNALITEYNIDGEEKELQKDFIYSTLSASSMGLVEILKNIPRNKGQNILLLIDQFEELFRFNQIRNNNDSFNEVLAYIKLILEAWKQTQVPVYVVLTMRSDFVGECAQFQELTHIINESHYLIPQMTREDFRDAITGPVAVGGGTISPHLVQQLLNDIGERPDQLPILQHAMMRTWEAWVNSGKTGAIDIRDYENIGKLEKALSEHANEAYNELNQEQKELCQSVFKSLTEKGSDNRGVRRPTKVTEIAAICGAKPDQVITVIDHFRIKGRSFLSPAAGVELTENSIIDISHESLMRIWDKLIVWVSEEYESVLIYKRLAESAEKYQRGISGLWRQPDLQLAISWKEKQKPTLRWAQRYNPAFERTMVFLDDSYTEYKLEEENKLRQQKQTLRRSKIFAIVLGSAAILSIFFMINSFTLKQRAVKQSEIAKQQSVIAQQEKENAVKQSQIAEEERNKAKSQEMVALEQKELAEIERQNAILNASEAKRQQRIADEKSQEASEQRNLAEMSLDEAKKQQQLAEEASFKAQRLRMLSISQSMAVKSVQMTIDTTLKALLAYQSFLFNSNYNGNKFSTDIYSGLYFAHKFLYGTGKTDYIGHNYPVRSLITNETDKVLFSTGNDGVVYKWSYNNSLDSVSVLKTSETNRAMILSSDKTKLFVGTSTGNIYCVKLNSAEYSSELLTKIAGVVNAFSVKDNNLYVFTSTGEIVVINTNDKSEQIVNRGIPVRGLSVTNNYIFAISPNGYLVKISGLESMNYKLYELNISDNGMVTNLNEVSTEQASIKPLIKINSVAHCDKLNLLALGTLTGDVILYNLKTLTQIQRLGGHTARINDLKFSYEKNMLASAGNDGISLIWNTSDFNLQPYVLADNDSWVNKLSFINNGNQLLIGYADGKIRKWQTESDSIAIKIKAMIKDNLTQEEWNRYVGKDIEYQKTIDNIPAHND